MFCSAATKRNKRNIFSSKIHTLFLIPKCNKNINYLFFSQHFCSLSIFSNKYFPSLSVLFLSFVMDKLCFCSTKKTLQRKKKHTQIWITRHVGVLLKSNRNTTRFRCCMEQLGMCFQRTRWNLAGYSSFRKSCYIGSKLFGCLH